MLSHTKYDEDIIVDLITQIFNLHIDLGYIPSECIEFPAPITGEPHQSLTATQDIVARHKFSPEVYSCFRRLRLNAAIPSLLERIPFLRSSVDNRDYPFYIFDAGLVSYDNIDSLEYSRDPRGINSSLDGDDPEGLLDGDEMALTVLMSRDGSMLILNVVESKTAYSCISSRRARVLWIPAFTLPQYCREAARLLLLFVQIAQGRTILRRQPVSLLLHR